MPENAVDISVSPRPQAQLLDVCMRFPATADAQTLLCFPVWTPGSYLVREHARHLQEIRAETLEGQPLPLERLGKNRLHLHNQGQAFQLHYSLWAAELSVRTNHVDDSHAFFNGAATFFFSENTRSLPHTLRLCLPPGWLSACALPQNGPLYVAQNFDELADSPVEMGPHAQPFSFFVSGVPHEVVWWGPPHHNMERLLDGLQTLCSSQAEFFKGLPMERYLFIVHSPEKGHGGLEHRASSTLLFGQENWAQKNSLENFFCLASHEYFHLWNVKRISPPALLRPDYEKECYTRMLWALEGGTCYYEKLLNFRAGLLSEARLLTLLSETLADLAATPGHLKMPLEEASLLAWTHHYRPNANTRNTGVSYYVKGEVVCFLLDISIRQLTDNQRSLDSVFHLLWQRVQAGEALLESAFEAAAVQVACAPLESFFNQALRSTEALDFSCLQHVGLEVCQAPLPQHPPHRLCLGVHVQGNLVGYVPALGAACKAGIQPGDELVALDGHKLSTLHFPEFLERASAPLTLHYFRRGRLCQTSISPQPVPQAFCSLRYVDNPSPAQQRARQGWLRG